MKWSEKAWSSVEPIYQKTQQLPFIQELIDGSLAREKFLFYIQQDSLYLAEYCKALTAIASRLSKPAHVETFIGHAGACMYVENELHKTIFSDYGVQRAASPTPSCLLYTSYLLSLLNGPVEVMTAAVLPCFWIYEKIGRYIAERETTKNNPYQSWIDTYGGEEFTESVNKTIAICDELAENASPAVQDAMTEAFIYATKFEWMFWESAYRLEEWEI